MSKEKELFKNTIIILAGKVSTQFISFLLLPLYTFVLTTEEYGVVDLVTTYVGLFAPLVSLQMENSIFRFLVDERKNTKKKSEIITNSYIVIVMLVLTLFIMINVVSYFVNIKYKVYICGMIISVIFSNILLQTSRGNGNNKTYSIGGAIAGVVTVVLNIFFLVIINTGIKGMFLSSIIGNSLCFLYVFIKEKAYKFIDFKLYNKEKIHQLLKYSLPLVPNGIIWWIINVSDRTIISMFLGSSANGIYSVSNKFSSIYIQLYNIFNLSWTETASLHINDSDKDEFFSKTIQQMFNFFSSICIGIIAFIPFVFPILINDKYTEAYRYIPILMVASLFNVIVGLISVIYVAKKLTKEIAKTSLLSGIINLIVNLILVKKIGIFAAAISTIFAFFSMALYRYIDVQKYVKIRFEFKNIVSIIIIFILTITIYYINIPLTNVFNLIIVFIYSIFSNIDMLKKIMKSIKQKKRG
ncbi:lipopolysaccharide biosynthesis protein [Clostridium butyricum]|jgi:O-antigen/teichoic acid export membrane protein|uniref:lipopolysaccharide biosynthesis protein n=1 Tax=Clostridium butyricum TaxID=1492 RepID=UPI0005EB3095|nr:oligosaccharide flippase family protein [Clostridium butyricum]MZI81736.1 oligosaccharide flippase family protein [Clostridium butyricum]